MNSIYRKRTLELKTIYLYLIFLLMIFTLVMYLPAGGFAQEDQSITLDQALEMALKTDSQVFNARNNLEKAKLAVKQEVLKTWPQASITDSVFDD